MLAKKHTLFVICFVFAFSPACKKDQLPSLITDEVELMTSGPTRWGLGGGTITSDGGNPVISKGVCWSTNETPTISDFKTNDGSGNESFKSMIEGLSSLTTYYVRAYATSEIGTGYGNQVSFTTPCIMLASINNLEIQLVSPSNGSVNRPIDLILEWQFNNFLNLDYDLFISKSTNFENKIHIGQIPKNLKVGSFKLIDLEVHTTYYWKVFAQDAALPCNNSFSQVWSFTTINELSLPTVITVSVYNHNDFFASLGGNVSSDGGTEVTDRGIYLGLNPSPELTGNKYHAGSGTGVFQSGISNLNPGTLFYLKAYAKNKIGISLGEEITFTTSAASERVIDVDGNIYKTIKIGNQTWLVENLKVTKYNDGTAIPKVTEKDSWFGLSSGAYCNYDNSDANGLIYGHLYNFFTVALNPIPKKGMG